MESFKQYPELANLIANYYTNAKETTISIVDENGKEVANVFDSLDKLIETCAAKVNDSSVSFEEQKYYIEKSQELVKEKAEVLAKNQAFHLNLKWLEIAGSAIGLVVAYVALGNRIDFKEVNFAKAFKKK